MSREKKPEEAKQATGGKARGCGKQELPTPVEFERELELWQLIRKCDKPGHILNVITPNSLLISVNADSLTVI